MLVKSYLCPAVVTGSSAGRRCKCAVAVWTPVYVYRTFQEQLAVRAGESVQLQQKAEASLPFSLMPFPWNITFLLQVQLDKNRAHLNALNRDPKCCFEWTLSCEPNTGGKFLCSFSFLWVTAHCIADQICPDYGKRENGKMTISPKQ